MKIKSKTTNNDFIVSFSSDEGLWYRPKRQGKSLLVEFDLIFIIKELVSVCMVTTKDVRQMAQCVMRMENGRLYRSNQYNHM